MIYFLWWRWHNGQNVGYDKSFSVFCLFSFISNRCCKVQKNFFCSCLVITLVCFFRKMVPVTAIKDEIYQWFSAMDNDLLHASWIYPEDKMEERIPFALFHAHLYLTESYDDWDDKYASANTFDISCGGGGSRYSF